ncbi:MAG: hypothetical protein R3D67_12460 [Hyphomicrobiaceae bacterium]
MVFEPGRVGAILCGMEKVADKKVSEGTKRQSRSGRYVIARPAVSSDKVTQAQIRAAIAKVQAARDAAKS